MSTDLGGALPQGYSFKKTELRCSTGMQPGFFVGLGTKHIEQHTKDSCRPCKGSGILKDDTCSICSGTGKKTTTKVPILWEIENIVEEEWVTYTLSEPGKLQDGTPKSASTLYTRMRVLSGGISEPGKLAEWYSGLQKPPRIPVELIILDKDNSDGSYIAQVKLANGLAPAGERSRAAHSDDEYDFPEKP